MATTQALFRKTQDAGEPLDISKELTVSDLIAWEVPGTGGPFVTGAPQSNTLSGEVLLRPLAAIAADTLSDPMTAANVELFKEVSEGGAAAQSYDDTSVAEYKVAWGGAAGGSNSSSSSVYVANDDTITLEHDGDYTFDALPYQTTLSQENGTATGGIFYLKTSTGSTIESLTFPWKKRDSNYNNFPYEGGRQTIYRANMTAGTYRLGFVSHAGAGGGNRVSYNGYCHVIVRRSSLLPTTGLLVDHINLTAGDSSPGTTDTYTVWGDAGETNSLGTFDVPIPSIPQLPTNFVNHGDWQGVNLNNAVTNGMLVGLGTGPAGAAAPHDAWTGSCKITAIGQWIQQDFLTSDGTGTVTGERFSRQSFDGGANWTGWFGQ